MNKQNLRLVYLALLLPLPTLCDQKTEKKAESVSVTPCQPVVKKEMTPAKPPILKKPAKKQVQRRPSKYKPTQDKSEKKRQIPQPDIAPEKTGKSAPKKEPVELLKKPEAPAPTAPRTITLKNELTKEMISYRYFSIDYTPEFKIMANGTEIKPGTAETVEIKNNKAEITYHYNFYNGYRKDTKKVELEIPDGSAFAFDFSWKKQPNLSLVPLETKEVPPIKDSTPSDSKRKS